MAGIWTADKIMALAPDPGSAKSGRELGTPRKWVTLGRSERAMWGECQGSGSKPYQTQIDPTEPAFRCSCPSRKFPCKHALGLFLLTDAHAKEFKQADEPAWVQQWLASRTQRAEKKAARAEAPAAPTDPAAQAKRAAERTAKVDAGLAELERWLHDLVRQGLAGAPHRPASDWEGMAKRLVDAQARGTARSVRELGTIPHTGEGWTDRLLERLGRLHLLLDAYRRIDALPVPLAADVRTLIGWPQDKESLAGEAAVEDRWLVLGQIVEEDDENLKAQRNWLWGTRAQRFALVLNFAYGNQPLDMSLVPGTAFEAGVTYFPSAQPMRATLGEQRSINAADPTFPGHERIDAALDAYADALGQLPWLERFPMALRSVSPALDGSRWLVRDVDGRALMLSPRFDRQWELLALSGGGPASLFGEWDGTHLLPMSIATPNGFHALA